MCECECKKEKTCESKKGWFYQAEGYYKLNDDLSSSLDYILFNVFFDDKIITTRVLEELPSEEEAIVSMMRELKAEFLRSLMEVNKKIMKTTLE